MARARSNVPLSRTVVVSVLIGEFVLGLVLAITVGALAAISVAEQYRESSQDVANTLAAALMPLIADQQPELADALLQNIVDSAGLDDIDCIRVIDSSGQVVLAHGDPDFCLVEAGEAVAADPWSVLFSNRLVSQTIEAGGLEVATVFVGLSPPQVTEVLAVPLAAAALVLVAVMLVSVPWTLWLVNREAVEPLHALEKYASRIAGGDLTPGPGVGTSAEISRLEKALESMAAQLEERQNELRGSYQDLEAAYTSLAKAKSEMEQLARIKEDFVAVAAHEIRAPLSTIRLHAETLKTGEVGQLDEEALRSVASIHAAATRLGSITSDLMDAALLERGEMPMRFETVWLDELVDEAVADADVLARQRGMRVRNAGELSETVLQGDALRLRQVLDNLLSNAIKYSPEGSEVVVRLREEDADVLIEVADRGIGIRPSDTARLFTLFGRLDLGDSRETAGLGLGLAISARIVRAHGGSIKVAENPDGVGSVFTVWLPRGSDTTGTSGGEAVVRVAREGQAS